MIASFSKMSRSYMEMQLYVMDFLYQLALSCNRISLVIKWPLYWNAEYELGWLRKTIIRPLSCFTGKANHKDSGKLILPTCGNRQFWKSQWYYSSWFTFHSVYLFQSVSLFLSFVYLSLYPIYLSTFPFFSLTHYTNRSSPFVFLFLHINWTS